MQRQETCRMAADTIKLLDEGGMQGAIANARAPRASKIFDHFFRFCGSTPSRSAIKSTTGNSSWFAPTMCGRSHIGSNLRQRYLRVGAINNKRSTWGVPTASERGAESKVAHKWARWLHNPCCLGGPPASERGAESEVAHKWARWLHNPCRLGGPHRFRAGSRIRGGPEVARWLHNPCRLGGPHRLGAGGRIRSGSSQKWILFLGGHATKQQSVDFRVGGQHQK